MRITKTEIILGIVKGILAGFSWWFAIFILWLDEEVLLELLPFDYLIFILSCFAIMFTLLFTLLPKRQYCPKNILIQDACSIGAFIPSIVLAFVSTPILANCLNLIKYIAPSLAVGMAYAVFTLIYICCMAATDLLIVIVVTIVTKRKKKKESKKLNSAIHLKEMACRMGRI